MKVKEIKYLMPPMDSVNDWLDVFVILEDDYCTNEFSYLIEVTTPQFLFASMGKFKGNFVPPGYPVSKLTDEIIEAAIQAYIDTEDDSYWLKLYHIVPTLDTEDINEILYRKKQYRKKKHRIRSKNRFRS